MRQLLKDNCFKDECFVMKRKIKENFILKFKNYN